MDPRRDGACVRRGTEGFCPYRPHIMKIDDAIVVGPPV